MTIWGRRFRLPTNFFTRAVVSHHDRFSFTSSW